MAGDVITVKNCDVCQVPKVCESDRARRQPKAKWLSECMAMRASGGVDWAEKASGRRDIDKSHRRRSLFIVHVYTANVEENTDPLIAGGGNKMKGLGFSWGR